jgi:hypothetical protein
MDWQLHHHQTKPANSQHRQRHGMQLSQLQTHQPNTPKVQVPLHLPTPLHHHSLSAA